MRSDPLEKIATRLSRTGRMYYVFTWTDYIDESYNGRTLCVGGWLARDDEWPKIENPWRQRIEHECRMSIKKGFPPISRYHAADCSSLRGEFDRSKGWDDNRQLRFSKRLFQILGASCPVGIVMGGGVDDFKRHFPADHKRFLKGIYYFSIIMHLYAVADVMKELFPNDRVTVYYDRTRDFGPMARKAFDSLMGDSRNAEVSKYFISMAPLGWEDAVALQPADLIVYEGMKRVDGSLRGEDAMRKSLQALIGKNVPIRIAHFTENALRHVIERKKSELEEEGRILDVVPRCTVLGQHGEHRFQVREGLSNEPRRKALELLSQSYKKVVRVPATYKMSSAIPAQELVGNVWGWLRTITYPVQWDMQGHAQKAKNLLDQVNNELKQAAEAANKNK